jgi:long-chain acyl-CoA synthetase
VALVARDLAIDRPDEIALRDERVAMNWGDVSLALNKVVNVLRAADVVGGRIAVFAENSAETLLAHLGGLLAGVSTVPVNFHLTAEEVAYIISDSGASIVFASPETLDRALEACAVAGVDRIIAWRIADGVGGQWSSWESEMASASDAEPPTDVAPQPNLLYTSGTTGRPKGVELPPTMFAGGATVVDHVEALRSNRFASFGTHLVVGPMYHTGPLSGFRLMAVGVPVVIASRFDAERTLALIDQYRCETTVMVPTHFVRMLALDDDVKARYAVSSMRLIAHTGAACPIPVKRSMIEWFGPVFSDAYGATEVGTVCGISSQEWLEHPGSVGRSVPPFTAVVFDDDDNEVAAGVEGRLFFSDATGRGVVYPNDPAKTAAAHIRPGVFTLGEIGYVDADGYVFITDRFSDMIVSGGVNIYPAEIEKVLIAHPHVADVAVIGVPHGEMGEAVKALVVARDGVTADAGALMAFCREQLAGYKCPRSLEIVESVGRTTMGKINKRELRRPYWPSERTIG